MRKPFLIGIAGGSGSGKSYFLEKLMEHFTASEVCVLSQDHYYLPISAQSLDEKGIANFDLPGAIDLDHFLSDLQQLISGKSVQKEEYTFNNPSRIPERLKFIPAPVIVVEGIFILYFERIASLLDLKIYLDAKEHTKLRRRFVRDSRERGYDHEDVLYRYENHVAPSFEKYIAPFMYEADMIVPNNAHMEKALDVFACYVRKMVDQGGKVID